MAIGSHHPPGEAGFVALTIFVMLAVVAATIVSVRDSKNGTAMVRSNVLYPVGKWFRAGHRS